MTARGRKISGGNPADAARDRTGAWLGLGLALAALGAVSVGVVLGLWAVAGLVRLLLTWGLG